MFREMLRFKQQLSREECVEVLKTTLRGVLSLNGDDGYPYGVPINHYYNEEDGALYFHGGKKGHKLDAICRDSKASFCVYDDGIRQDGEWFLRFRSVIVFGRIELIEDEETLLEMSRRLSYKFTRDEEYISDEIKNHAAATLMFRLVPEHISGKRVKES